MQRTRSGWKRHVAAVVAALSLAGAAPGQAQPAANGPVLTEQNNGQTVDARVGQTLTLKLHENATTGYVWAVDQVNPRIADVRQAERRRDAQRFGAGDIIELFLTPTGVGTTTVALKRWRPWEGAKSIVQRFRIEVRVLP